jgi:hypothetical protein
LVCRGVCTYRDGSSSSSCERELVGVEGPFVVPGGGERVVGQLLVENVAVAFVGVGLQRRLDGAHRGHARWPGGLAGRARELKTLLGCSVCRRRHRDARTAGGTRAIRLRLAAAAAAASFSRARARRHSILFSRRLDVCPSSLGLRDAHRCGALPPRRRRCSSQSPTREEAGGAHLVKIPCQHHTHMKYARSARNRTLLFLHFRLPYLPSLMLRSPGCVPLFSFLFT